MTRIVLTYVLPLVLPTMAYLAWIWYARKRAAVKGDEAPDITKGGLFWSLICGLGLVIVGLAWLAVTTGADPGSGGYQAPRLEDGRIIPFKFN